MASSKDQALSRPVSGGFARVSSSSRSHSNSLSLSATNNTHRVHRRKSVNASASSTAHAAIAAALRENGDPSTVPLPPPPPHRRSVGSKKPTETYSMSARPSMQSYFGPVAAQSIEQDTFDDMSVDEDDASGDKTSIKNRNRRASEGSHLLKGTSKKGELRCDTCGKGYKHSSCLTKHMWEHNPAWAVTSKFLISKHQQVQLLEAASVLCNMTAEGSPDMLEHEAGHMESSDGSSGSPVYSGSSEMQDETSSAETTPPPMIDEYPVSAIKRYSTSSNGFSRSYRSVASSSYADTVFSPGLPPQRLSGVDFRPLTSGTDDGSLAAATAVLNMAGSSKHKSSMTDDIPPVPPVPRQYMHNPFVMHPPSLSHQISEERGFRGGYEPSIDYASNNNHMDEEPIFAMDRDFLAD